VAEEPGPYVKPSSGPGPEEPEAEAEPVFEEDGAPPELVEDEDPEALAPVGEMEELDEAWEEPLPSNAEEGFEEWAAQDRGPDQPAPEGDAEELDEAWDEPPPDEADEGYDEEEMLEPGNEVIEEAMELAMEEEAAEEPESDVAEDDAIEQLLNSASAAAIAACEGEVATEASDAQPWRPPPAAPSHATDRQRPRQAAFADIRPSGSRKPAGKAASAPVPSRAPPGDLRGEVRYELQEHAWEAQQRIDGTVFEGGMLSVKLDASSKDGTKVLVSGIAQGICWQELKDHFSQIGTVSFAGIKGDAARRDVAGKGPPRKGGSKGRKGWEDKGFGRFYPSEKGGYHFAPKAADKGWY